MPPKRFVFRLETVLKVKLNKEEEEKKKYGELIQLLAYEQRKLAQLEQSLAGTKHLRKSTLGDQGRDKGIPPDELRRMTDHEKKLEKYNIRQQQRIAEVEEALEQQRLALMEAMKERKVLEALKEQQQEQFTKEMDEEEAKMIDELATLKYARDAGKDDED